MGKSRKAKKLRLDARPSGETLVDATLTERDSTHGLFANNAYVSQSLKKFIREQPGWQELGFDMKEAIDMQFLKLSRILSGKCATKDHWVDIAGYAMLVADELDD